MYQLPVVSNPGFNTAQSVDDVPDMETLSQDPQFQSQMLAWAAFLGQQQAFMQQQYGQYGLQNTYPMPNNAIFEPPVAPINAWQAAGSPQQPKPPTQPRKRSSRPAVTSQGYAQQHNGMFPHIQSEQIDAQLMKKKKESRETGKQPFVVPMVSGVIPEPESLQPRQTEGSGPKRRKKKRRSSAQALDHNRADNQYYNDPSAQPQHYGGNYDAEPQTDDRRYQENQKIDTFRSEWDRHREEMEQWKRRFQDGSGEMPMSQSQSYVPSPPQTEKAVPRPPAQKGAARVSASRGMAIEVTEDLGASTASDAEEEPLQLSAMLDDTPSKAVVPKKPKTKPSKLRPKSQPTKDAATSWIGSDKEQQFPSRPSSGVVTGLLRIENQEADARRVLQSHAYSELFSILEMCTHGTIAIMNTGPILALVGELQGTEAERRTALEYFEYASRRNMYTDMEEMGRSGMELEAMLQTSKLNANMSNERDIISAGASAASRETTPFMGQQRPTFEMMEAMREVQEAESKKRDVIVLEELQAMTRAVQDFSNQLEAISKAVHAKRVQAKKDREREKINQMQDLETSETKSRDKMILEELQGRSKVVQTFSTTMEQIIMAMQATRMKEVEAREQETKAEVAKAEATKEAIKAAEAEAEAAKAAVPTAPTKNAAKRKPIKNKPEAGSKRNQKKQQRAKQRKEFKQLQKKEYEQQVQKAAETGAAAPGKFKEFIKEQKQARKQARPGKHVSGVQVQRLYDIAHKVDPGQDWSALAKILPQAPGGGVLFMLADMATPESEHKGFWLLLDAAKTQQEVSKVSKTPKAMDMDMDMDVDVKDEPTVDERRDLQRSGADDSMQTEVEERRDVEDEIDREAQRKVEELNATIRIQTLVRRALARMLSKKMKKEKEEAIQFYIRQLAVEKLEGFAVMIKARKEMQARKELKAKEMMVAAAATKVQSKFRSYCVRSKLAALRAITVQEEDAKLRDRASTKIQAGYRGFKSRREHGRMQSKGMQVPIGTVFTIQRMLRGFLARREVQKIHDTKHVSGVQVQRLYNIAHKVDPGQDWSALAKILPQIGQGSLAISITKAMGVNADPAKGPLIEFAVQNKERKGPTSISGTPGSELQLAVPTVLGSEGAICDTSITILVYPQKDLPVVGKGCIDVSDLHAKETRSMIVNLAPRGGVCIEVEALDFGIKHKSATPDVDESSAAVVESHRRVSLVEQPVMEPVMTEETRQLINELVQEEEAARAVLTSELLKENNELSEVPEIQAVALESHILLALQVINNVEKTVRDLLVSTEFTTRQDLEAEVLKGFTMFGLHEERKALDDYCTRDRHRISGLEDLLRLQYEEWFVRRLLIDIGSHERRYVNITEEQHFAKLNVGMIERAWIAYQFRRIPVGERVAIQKAIAAQEEAAIAVARANQANEVAMSYMKPHGASYYPPSHSYPSPYAPSHGQEYNGYDERDYYDAPYTSYGPSYAPSYDPYQSPYPYNPNQASPYSYAPPPYSYDPIYDPSQPPVQLEAPPQPPPLPMAHSSGPH